VLNLQRRICDLADSRKHARVDARHERTDRLPTQQGNTLGQCSAELDVENVGDLKQVPGHKQSGVVVMCVDSLCGCIREQKSLFPLITRRKGFC